MGEMHPRQLVSLGIPFSVVHRNTYGVWRPLFGEISRAFLVVVVSSPRFFLPLMIAGDVRPLVSLRRA